MTNTKPMRRLCPCGGWLINANHGRVWVKSSGQWKYSMKCKRCGTREVFYVSPTGEIAEIGARPTGRPPILNWGVPDAVGA